MSNEKAIGGFILLASISGIIAYFWLLFISQWAMITIQISAFLAVTAVLLIVAWIGYTLATTPPPIPLEDLNFDLDDQDDESDNK